MAKQVMTLLTMHFHSVYHRGEVLMVHRRGQLFDAPTLARIQAAWGRASRGRVCHFKSADFNLNALKDTYDYSYFLARLY
jgi:hypothetical protein